MRALLTLAAALALAAGGYAAASSWAGAPAQAPVVVRVLADDFSFSLSRRIVPVGRVRFVVVNKGVVGHDFAVSNRKTGLLRPGRSATIEITFTRAGSQPYRCTVSGHAALGMKGVLTVGRAATTAKPTTTTVAKPTTTSEPSQVTLTKIGDFERPVYVTAPLGDPERLFVVEQAGTIQEVVPGQGAELFLDLTGQVEEVSERGLLSMALAPDYATSGRFYVYYTDRVGNGNVNVVEYRRSATSPDSADPSSARPILSIEKPYENHNAGMLQFGPDGYLYIGVGDGDSGVFHDPGAFAQTLDDLLGNILRIDPLHPSEGGPTASPTRTPSSPRRTRAARSGTTASATPGGSGSIRSPATCTSVTPGSVARRSWTTPRGTGAGSTSAGRASRAPCRSTVRGSATASSRPCSNTTTATAGAP